MRGVKPYMNATGNVFTIYECSKTGTSTNSDFDADTIMGAVLLGIHDKRIDDLDQILYELTRNSEKISSRQRISVTPDLPAKRSDKEEEIRMPVKDKDDRLIYTYRPFKELATFGDKAKNSKSKSRTRS